LYNSIGLLFTSDKYSIVFCIYAGASPESHQRKLSERILEVVVAILRRNRDDGLARPEGHAIEVAMDTLRDMRVRRHNPLYRHRYWNRDALTRRAAMRRRLISLVF
jgi:hypothetical protein